ncbi:MAG: PAS domain-containing protein, partial [Calditerrivibrio sp.]|uniref:PAS domain-containing protein n=2 Tax=Calditerrivibrio sp. TaxID=2792612 RepID=UPI003D127877
RIFFDINSLIFREEYILYPAMDEILEQDVQIKILKDIVDSNLIKIDYNFDKFEEKSLQQGKVLDLGTGELTLEQIKLIFNHIPVDITYIDENDEVRYFSTPKDRTFVRTKSVIGRKVQNCHPHESVEVVNKIIESFKKGEKNHAFFWIPYKNKFLFIQYYAVVNEKGEYKGIVEVTQDISEIQKITGVKRLLDW